MNNMYGIFTHDQSTQQHGSIQLRQYEQELREAIERRRRQRQQKILQKQEEAAEEEMKAAVNAILKQHQEAIVPQTKEETRPLLLHRDSYSTITTAVETPDNSTKEENRQPESRKGLLPHEMIICVPNDVDHDQEDLYLLSTLQKAKKFIPDAMNVGDFYGDDDEEALQEDIVFVPPESLQNPFAEASPKFWLTENKSKASAQKAPTSRLIMNLPTASPSTSIARSEAGRRTLRRHGSGGLECIRPPARNVLEPPARQSLEALFAITRVEI